MRKIFITLPHTYLSQLVWAVSLEMETYLPSSNHRQLRLLHKLMFGSVTSKPWQNSPAPFDAVRYSMAIFRQKGNFPSFIIFSLKSVKIVWLSLVSSTKLSTMAGQSFRHMCHNNAPLTENIRSERRKKRMKGTLKNGQICYTKYRKVMRV